MQGKISFTSVKYSKAFSYFFQSLSMLYYVAAMYNKYAYEDIIL